MTENKRFTFVQESLVKADVFDEETGDFICCTLSVWVEQLVDLLNSLSEENKQLKEQLEICKDARQAYKQDWKACVSYCDTYKDEIHTLKDNIQGLIEENKQLKKEVEDLKQIYQKKEITYDSVE